MLDLLCTTSGANGGTLDCAPTPGVGKFIVVWGGSLTPSQLQAGIATCKAALIADSKRSKFSSRKLLVLPLARNFTPKKEANQVVTLADGFTQVTREGLPAYDVEVLLDMYLAPKLRALNNKRIKYAIWDDKNQMLATLDSAGNYIGRYGKFYTEGVDAHGFDKVDGQTMISLQAENAYETFDFPVAIQFDSTPDRIFKSLKDMNIYEKATATPIVVVAAVGATRTVTLTAVGADGDTIDILDEDGESLTGGPVAKTSSESTVTLLAVKVKDAINAATSTNGGFTATNVAGVLTITAPTSLGATINGDNTAPTIVGTMTATNTAFASGVTGTYSYALKLSAKATSPIATAILDFYTDYSASALGTDKTLWKITNTADGSDVGKTSVAPNAGGYFLLTPVAATVAAIAPGTVLLIELVAPELLDAAGVVGIEGIALEWTKP